MEPRVQKFEDLDKLSTSELEQRETEYQSTPYPEPYEQWRQIKAAYENQKATTEKTQKTFDLSEGKKNRVARKRHAWRPFVAAVSAAALIAVIIIPAEGFKGVSQALAEWTNSVFYLLPTTSEAALNLTL